MVRWLVIVVGVGVAMSAWAAEPPVKAGLLADRKSVAAGESVEVGVLLQVAEGWHVYWKNPGDAGMATAVEWSLPAGAKVSALSWPTPIEFSQPGDIAGFGYEHEVMLIARVSPPTGFSGPLPVQARVQWLSCKEQCVTGQASLSTTVNVGGATEKANEETFARWRKRMPDESGRAKVTRKGLSYQIELGLGEAAKQAQVFVAPPEELAVGSREATGTAQGITAQVTLTPLAGEKVSGKPAEAVVAWRDDGNETHSIGVSLPTD